MVCSMKSMSKTKLPSECATGTPATASTPCTQCGWPPATRSAPARTRARATVRWTGSGVCMYCSAPVREHDDDVGRSRRTADRGRDARQVGRDQRAGARRHPDRQGAGLGGTCHRGLADRVEARGIRTWCRRPRAAPAPRPRAGPARLRTTRSGFAAARAPCRGGRPRRSRPHGCSPATARRSRRRVAAGAAPGCLRRSRSGGPAVGSPRRDSVLSRLPTVRSAPRSSDRIGASAAAGSGTPRTSMRSPTMVTSMASAASRPGRGRPRSRPPPSARLHRAGPRPGSLGHARRRGSPGGRSVVHTRKPRQRSTAPLVSRSATAVRSRSCGTVA